MKYGIYLNKQKGGKPKLLKLVDTLAEAQEICNDPETSSMTASKPRGCNGSESLIEKWHARQAHWFYGFSEYK